jgi:hypothetical protein
MPSQLPVILSRLRSSMPASGHLPSGVDLNLCVGNGVADTARETRGLAWISAWGPDALIDQHVTSRHAVGRAGELALRAHATRTSADPGDHDLEMRGLRQVHLPRRDWQKAAQMKKLMLFAPKGRPTEHVALVSRLPSCYSSTCRQKTRPIPSSSPRPATLAWSPPGPATAETSAAANRCSTAAATGRT